MMSGSGRAILLAVALGPLAPACNARFTFDALDASAPDGAAPDATAMDVSPGCTMDEDCGLIGLHCAAGEGRCYECLSDAHCLRPGVPRCDLLQHRCVPCVGASDCGPGQTCERDDRICIDSCTRNSDCPERYVGCNQARGICVNCLIDEDCAGSPDRLVCDRSSGRCVECDDQPSCPDGHGRCDAYSGHCVACLSSTDCGDLQLVCDPVELVCVARR